MLLVLICLNTESWANSPFLIHEENLKSPRDHNNNKGGRKSISKHAVTNKIISHKHLAMVMDQDAIKKRFSQIEDDINNMNKMIDDNLQIYDTKESESNTKFDTINENPEVSSDDLNTTSDGNAGATEVSSNVTIENPNVIINTVNVEKTVLVSPKEFSAVTASAADTFIGNSLKNEAVDELTNHSTVKGNADELKSVSNNDIVKNNKEIPPNVISASTEVPTKDQSVAVPVAGEPLQEVCLQKDNHATQSVQANLESKDLMLGPQNQDISASKMSSKLTEQAPINPPEDAQHADSTADKTVIDQSTNTSEDFQNESVPFSAARNSSQSSSMAPLDQIVIPKNNAQVNNVTSPSSTPTTPSLRRPTNPFRVVSVGTAQDVSSRKSSRSSAYDESSNSEVGGTITKLEKRHDYLTKKCSKLQKEIVYLHGMSKQSALPIEDKRKLIEAIGKLQEYLDSKTKEKYEVGVQLSRQLRKEIDRGENGQFWVGTK